MTEDNNINNNANITPTADQAGLPNMNNSGNNAHIAPPAPYRGAQYVQNSADNDDSPAAEKEAAPAPRAKKKGKDAEEDVSIPALLFDIAETLAVAACAIVLIFVSVFRIATVKGPSMNKTLFEGDVLIVSDLGYKPRTGDIVVFYKDEALVKRVIATEGQTVDIDFDTWTVTVDGVELDESEYRYLSNDGYRRLSDFTYPITLGKGEMFVMGDNRNHSTDSRSLDIGIVDERTVFGRVIMRISPISEFTIFKRK